MSSVFGKLFTLATWGESHGKAVGAVVDGCPAGLALSESDIQPFLDRRRPGQSKLTTQRKESDAVEILSGVFIGDDGIQRATGTPISMIVKNADQHSADYEQIKDWYRPGHADEVYDSKYGFRDYRGGGRSSARETIARVAGGAIARKLLFERAGGVEFDAWVSEIGGVSLSGTSSLRNAEDDAIIQDVIEKVKSEQDSVGGIVSLRIKNVPKNLGEPIFDRAEALLAMAMMSIPASKGFEVGEGFKAANLKGSEDNKLDKNHAGGVYGGITSGEDIFCRVAFKPTPSISQMQKAKNKIGDLGEISIKGRHDPCVALRAPVIVESMAALVLADLWLQNKARV